MKNTTYKSNDFTCNLFTTESIIRLILSGGNKFDREKLSNITSNMMEKINNNPRKLLSLNRSDLKTIPGMTNKMIDRFLVSNAYLKKILNYIPTNKTTISDPNDVADLLHNEMKLLRTEVFRILILNTNNNILKIETISKGILDASLVHPREVFYPAIMENASSIILVHNHPSGNPTPSQEDLGKTKQLIKAGEILDIEVIDHIIFGDPKWVSMKEMELI